MASAQFYLHALRTARPRQLLARATRPVRRRRFPHAPASRLGPVAGAEPLWRSPAFDRAELDARGVGTRLYAFHKQYGEDVLEAARAGDVQLARERVAAWIEAHPPAVGDPWHPYVVSTRAGNWVAALTLEPSLATSGVSESLARQLAYVAANVEDDVLGNHVIRNARALVLGGIALGSGRLTQRGLELLRRELPEQVLSDGGHYERSPVYHAIVLRDLLEVQGVTSEPFLAPVIDRMRHFAAALARPDGAPALFNDGALDLAPVLELPPPPAGVAAFAETGYAVVRTDRIWLAFDCGPPAPDFLPAHAHADALSFQLWIDGRPLVVDPGTSTYEAGVERDRLRSSAAHATVTIDGGSQFRPWGAFRSGPLPKVEILDVRENSIAAAVHWAGGLVHERRIEWQESAIAVHDRVDGPGSHVVESRLPVTPGGMDLVAGDVQVEQGCWSERLFDSRPLDVLVRRTAGSLPLKLDWQIRLGSGSILEQ
jgi:uncharacterized heparinase superfamily protein